jgi:hypothetical protein
MRYSNRIRARHAEALQRRGRRLHEPGRRRFKRKPSLLGVVSAEHEPDGPVLHVAVADH